MFFSRKKEPEKKAKAKPAKAAAQKKPAAKAPVQKQEQKPAPVATALPCGSLRGTLIPRGYSRP